MSELRIASRYAKSLLELAVEKKAIAKVVKDMELFSSICESNRDFVIMLRNPVINHGQKLKILQSVFTDKVNSMTMSILEIITRKGREQYLPEIASAFKQQYNKMKGIVEASVTTVVPLSATLKKEVNKVLKGLSDGGDVELTEIVDPDIIGGFVLKIGDKQIDDSVSGRLRELKLQFKESNI